MKEVYHEGDLVEISMSDHAMRRRLYKQEEGKFVAGVGYILSGPYTSVVGGHLTCIYEVYLQNLGRSCRVPLSLIKGRAVSIDEDEEK